MTSPRPAQRALLRQHDFRQLFGADVAAQLGTQLSTLAIPVTAVELLGARELEMGLLGTAENLAFLLIALPAGVWVDRWRKQRVLVTADLLRALALVTIPLAWWLDVLTFGQLLLVTLVIGTATVFFDVAYQSYLPEIVEPDDIGRGNAQLQAVQSVAMIGGPALGGVLVRVVGGPWTSALNAVGFLGSALFVRRIRRVFEPPPREDRRPLHVEVREGLGFVLRHPLLWRITACTAISNLFSAATGALLVLFALRELGLTEAELGLAMGVGAAGGLLGALATPALTRRLGEGRIIPFSALVMVPAGLPVPLAGTVLDPLPAIVVSSLLLTFSVVVYNVTQVSFRQRLCPRPLLGRMNASIRFLVWGVMPIGAFAGGLLGEGLGVRAVFWIALVGQALAAAPVVLSPLRRMGDLPRELDRLSAG